MDFKLLENLSVSEIEKIFENNLFISATRTGGCGCTYASQKGRYTSNTCSTSYDGVYVYISCPSFSKYATPQFSRIGVNFAGDIQCQNVCREMGLVDWFYG